MESVDDTLSLTDSASLLVIWHLAASLSVSDAAVATKIKPASSVLSLSDSVVLGFELTIAILDTLTLESFAGVVTEVDVTSTLSLSDSAVAELSHLAVSALSLSDTAIFTAQFFELVADIITLVDTVAAYSSHIFDAISLSDSVSLTISTSLSDPISLSSEAVRVVVINITDDIGIYDTVAEVASHAVAQVISVTDTVVLDLVVTLHVVDTLALTNGVIGYTPAGQSPCDDANVHNLGTRDHITLTYSDLTLDMRNPRFGNSQIIATQTVIRRTRGGTLRVIRGSAWTTIRTFRMSFEGLSVYKRNEFLDFITQSAGYEIGLTDQDNREWAGVMLSPEVVTSQRGRNCNFEAAFEFRGNLV